LQKKYLHISIAKLKFVFLFSVIFLYHDAHAQPRQFNTLKISTESGLYANDIRHLIKDRNGFLWVAASNKIQRYDGRFTKDFYIKDGNTYYRGLAEDKEGKIWTATNNNLYWYKNDYEGFIKFTDSSIAGSYLALIEGPAKTVYILCRKGIVYMDEKANQLKPLPVTNFQMSNGTYFPFISFKEFLFWSNRSGVYRYNLNTAAVDSVAASLTRTIEMINEDSMWVGNTSLSSALISFPAKTNVPVTAKQFDGKFSTNDFFISGVFRVSSQYLFVPIRYKGFFIYNVTNNRFTPVDVYAGGTKIKFDEAPKTGVYSYGVTDAWLNLTDGLYYVIPESRGFAHFNIIQADDNHTNEGSNSIRNYAEDNNNNLWMATGNGLAKWNRNTNQTKVFLPERKSGNALNFASVRGVAVNGNNLLVTQSQGGSFLFNLQKETFGSLNYPNGSFGDSVKRWMNGDFISGLFTLKNGNFITASNRRIFLIDKKTNQVSPVTFKGKPSVNFSRIVFEDKQQRLWFLGGPGITIADSSFNILHQIPSDKLNGNYTNSITQISDTAYWVAWEGLHEVIFNGYSQPVMHQIFAEVGNQVFYTIFKDSSGYCWAAGEKGIYKLYPDKKSFQLFDRSENVLNYQYSSALPFRSSNGNVFLQGYSGVTYFNPEKLTADAVELHPNISSVKVNGNDSLFYQQKATLLTYNQNGIEINFIAPYIQNGNKVQYRYQMLGLDIDWIYAGNNTSIRFSSLAPGKYTFTVAASLNGKDWYTATPFSFEIKPPFWKTWWFQLLTVLTVAAIVFLVIRIRINNIKKTASIKQQLTELEVKALRAQMNPHFIFNAMNSIQHFVFNKDVDKASHYLTEFSRLLRMVLQHSKQPTISLTDEMNILDLYLKIEALRMGPEFIYNITAEETIEETDAVKIPSMLVQPFVENALKHGLYSKIGDKKVTINFTMPKDGELICIVIDNGIGRERASAESAEQMIQMPHGGDGIALVKNRLQLHDDDNRNAISIIDLKNEDGSAAGTRVEIHIRLN
jgi:hypothetical protein